MGGVAWLALLLAVGAGSGETPSFDALYADLPRIEQILLYRPATVPQYDPCAALAFGRLGELTDPQDRALLLAELQHPERVRPGTCQCDGRLIVFAKVRDRREPHVFWLKWDDYSGMRLELANSDHYMPISHRLAAALVAGIEERGTRRGRQRDMARFYWRQFCTRWSGFTIRGVAAVGLLGAMWALWLSYRRRPRARVA